MRPIRFIFALHNHQPVGNFSSVFEETYQQSYLPFLDLFEGYANLKIALHTSGSLLEWLADEHPEYLDRVASLVQRHRIEIIGGPFFEPILAMLPSRDRIGQIEMLSDYLKQRLGAEIAGLWIPERVWEQSYVRDLVDAGMRYTILDDTHFKYAGIADDKLTRHYLTEDDGKTINVFPGSERLRYLIPFGRVDEVIEYFAQAAEKDGQAVIVHGDDGEKFGTWPKTYDHVYGDKWLIHFFDALSENSHWIQTTTPSEALAAVPPLGKIYIPDGSYREMNEWVMPPERQKQLDELRHNMEFDHRWPTAKQFIRGGFWRNFKIRYPESDEMYCRMMSVSMRLQKAIDEGWYGADIDLARESLYRSQCNCSYWHGAFGGIYLPHLRNAVYRELIHADRQIDFATGRTEPYIESQIADFNFDGKNEVRMTTDQLQLLVVPQQGGMMSELDIKTIGHNLLATLTRRPEAYHQKVLDSQQQGDNSGDSCASIHDRVVCKQKGLDKQLQYDEYPRKSLIDLFYDFNTDIDAVRKLRVGQHGDFVQGEYDAVVRKKAGRMQILMSREAKAYGADIRIDKAVTMQEGSNEIEIAYRLSQLPKDYQFHFAVEFNFAGMPGGAEGRFFYGKGGPYAEQYGDLRTSLDLTGTDELGLFDDWLGLGVTLQTNRATDFYTFPIETVSQSEGGFELVHQSVAVQPHWKFVPDSSGIWTVEMRLVLDTTIAMEREQEAHAILRDAARVLVEEV